jgi:hypothetical protein
MARILPYKPKKQRTNNLALDFGRHGPIAAHGEYTDVWCPAFVQTWETARQRLKSIRIPTDRRPVTIKADWSCLVQYCERTRDTEAAIGEAEIRRELKRLHAVTTEVPIVASSAFAVQYYLYDVFLLINLACPGALDLGSAQITDPTEPPRLRQTKIELYALPWSMGWLDSLRGSKPAVSSLDFDTTYSWFSRFAFRLAEVGESPLQRAIFCLLYASREDGGTAADLIWLGHALEALYEVPSALSFNLIRDRAKLLLDVGNPKQFSKDLRAFYDTRNAFAHGGLRLPHPLFTLPWNDADTVQARILEQCNFGFRLVLATLQEMVRRQLGALNFTEVIAGSDDVVPHAT